MTLLCTCIPKNLCCRISAWCSVADFCLVDRSVIIFWMKITVLHLIFYVLLRCGFFGHHHLYFWSNVSAVLHKNSTWDTPTQTQSGLVQCQVCQVHFAVPPTVACLMQATCLVLLDYIFFKLSIIPVLNSSCCMNALYPCGVQKNLCNWNYNPRH